MQQSALINQQLRQIRQLKSLQNMQQKKIFQHLIKNNLQLDLKNPSQLKVLINGIPQMYRDIVWTQIMKNNHGITNKFYDGLIQRVKESYQQIHNSNNIQKQRDLNELHLERSKSQGYTPSQQLDLQGQKISKWFSTISMDIPRTFSQLKIFSQQSLESKMLEQILCCWCIYRQDIGYRQGMSQIAGYLLVQLSSQITSFRIFCSFVTCSTLFQFYCMNVSYICEFSKTISTRLHQTNPSVHILFQQSEVDYKIFIMQWIMTMFTKVFQFGTVGMIWDYIMVYQLREQVFVEVIVALISGLETDIKRLCQESQNDGMMIGRFLKKVKVSQIKQQEILAYLRSITF